MGLTQINYTTFYNYKIFQVAAKKLLPDKVHFKVQAETFIKILDVSPLPGSKGSNLGLPCCFQWDSNGFLHSILSPVYNLLY